jgi:hypothetical protein
MLEDAAITLVNSDEDSSDRSTVPYAFVLAFVEHHHLLECILSQLLIRTSLPHTFRPCDLWAWT